MKNLKKLLMELGNHLVLTHKFLPAVRPSIIADAQLQSTQPIKDFTEYLNRCPEARAWLASQGIEWPVVTDTH